MLIELVTLVLCQAPPIQGVVVGPSAESSIVFSDRGRTYRVGIETGRVYFADTGPQPQPPDIKPIPDLTGFARTVYDSFMGLNLTDRQTVALELIHCVDVTLAKAGGLQLKPQEIINELADVIALKGLAGRLVGWRLGDLIATQGQGRDEILAALAGVRQAMGAVK